MFPRKLWHPRFIVRRLSKIPLWHAHFMLFLALLGGLVGLAVLLLCLLDVEALRDKTNSVIAFAIIGVMLFALLPLPYIIYLAKDVETVRQEPSGGEERQDSSAEPPDGSDAATPGEKDEGRETG